MAARLEEKLRAAVEVDDNDAVKADSESLESLAVLPFDEKQSAFRDQMAIQALRIPALIAGLSRDDLLRHADRIHKLEQVARRALNLEEPAPAPVINIGLLTASAELPPLEISKPAVNSEGALE